MAMLILHTSQHLNITVNFDSETCYAYDEGLKRFIPRTEASKSPRLLVASRSTGLLAQGSGVAISQELGNYDSWFVRQKNDVWGAPLN